MISLRGISEIEKIQKKKRNRKIKIKRFTEN